MANFTLATGGAFADGVTLGAYPASAWAGRFASGTPLGSATNTQTVSGQSVTFTGLTAGVSYYAAVNSSNTNYIHFTVPSTDLPSDDLDTLAAAVQARFDTVNTTTSGLSTGLLAEAGARASADANLDRNDGQAGIIAPSFYTGGGTLTLIANRAYLGRFVPSKAMSVTGIAYVVTTAATADDPVDVGIYNGTTLARVASSGVTTGKLNATGPTTVSITASLTAGTVYYAAIAVGAIGGTGAALATGTFAATNAGRFFGYTNPQAYHAYTDTAHPLPNPVTWGTAAASMPMLAVKGT